MYLKQKSSADLVEVLDTKALFDPTATTLVGRFHAGEELQDPETFDKSDLIFPSDEPLPRCWVDSKYRMG